MSIQKQADFIEITRLGEAESEDGSPWRRRAARQKFNHATGLAYKPFSGNQIFRATKIPAKAKIGSALY